MSIRIFILSFCLFFIGISAIGQTVAGKWVTIDDETGKQKSVVEIYLKNGKLHGKIIKLFREPDQEQDPICLPCIDDRKNQRIIGMEIIRDLKPDGKEWQDGTICDPKNGKVYDCAIWLNENDPNKLEVRGYWGFFYRTQVWIRSRE